ncbi:MAG: diguanylate cyclase [Chloroflexota bacterium]
MKEVFEWAAKMPVAATVTNAAGEIVYMNDKSDATFASDGGREGLVGKNIYDCHGENSRQKLDEIIEQKSLNCYTIEKKGVRKMIYQTPYFSESGEYLGLVELSLEIPGDMPHFKRD